MRRRWVLCALLALLAVAGRPITASAAEKEKSFPMKEVSAFQEGFQDWRLGQRASCSQTVSQEKRIQVKCASEKPYFGEFSQLGASDKACGFAVDESGGTGKGYDRLYLDMNRDGSLEGEKAIGVMKDPPRELTPPYSGYKYVVFEAVEMRVNGGDGIGERTIKVVPMLTIRDQYADLALIPTTVRQGEIEFGGKRFIATLTPSYYELVTRYDQPGAGFHLSPAKNPSAREYWWGADRLNSMRVADGKWFSFAATPEGDKLFVREYQGDLGLFKAGSGKRGIEEVTMSGSLTSKKTAVPVGRIGNDPDPQAIKEMLLPVGDYYPAIMSMQMKDLRLRFSNNYHADGKAQMGSLKMLYSIQIRKDRPFTLDFSNKPEVIFPSPAKDAKVRRGETLETKAVLIDPKLDIMIRGLDDMGQQVDKTFSLASGGTQTFKQPRSLDPEVVITRANGEEVVRGVMPFG